MIPEFTNDATWGDLLGPAMEIANRGDTAEAETFLTRYVDYLMRRNPEWGAEQAQQTALSNLGYWSGYYDRGTMAAVGDVFGAAHPVFGRTPPESAEAAFQAGVRQASR